MAEAGEADPAELAEDVDLSRSKVLEAVSRLEEVGFVEVSDEGDVVRRDDAPPLQEAIEEGAEASEEREEFEKSRLEMMRSYAEHNGCRRDFVLSYFGEEHGAPCGNCDNCDAGLVEPEADVERPFDLGAAVTHSEWGQGEVQRYDDNRVVILFESVGYRTLDLDLVSEKGLLQAT